MVDVNVFRKLEKCMTSRRGEFGSGILVAIACFALAFINVLTQRIQPVQDLTAVMSAKAETRKMLDALNEYKKDMGTYPSGSTATTLCPILMSELKDKNGNKIGPWMSSCDEATKWGEIYQFDSLEGIVYVKSENGKYITTRDLSSEKDSYK